MSKKPGAVHGVLSQAEAAEVLGMERTFRRWRTRYEAEGAEGLYDRRLDRVSARRAPVDEVMAVLELFDTRYWDFGVKHLYETLAVFHGPRRLARYSAAGVLLDETHQQAA